MAVITPGTSEIHRLNDVAADIWELCAGEGATLEQLLQTLRDRYDVPDDVLRLDVATFLQFAIGKGLLREDDTPGTP